MSKNRIIHNNEVPVNNKKKTAGKIDGVQSFAIFSNGYIVN